ncbi:MULTISPECIES: ABC transporter substrate-binding protein [unclassified Brenneria]|uniref:ABC transporter substrate-binding protein n=1 Tax=unclassified Brenneria TaxID=2634434 RepID=UPI001557676C|nr:MULTISPECIES: ABC transporter substrate-binding protein [unclassified Brenneria]MBJ7223943.1 ABC transporter substrate-binding protein [Brenneria sp. L3-3C-1]MEE3645187.1 ABC transporter substrate-binding protein [Brenneria sp. L3_3C_1]MEE3649930.1 ABC transporter substrate-binding protein [Brenneria sp. HEZEL_4_2_4]NPC99888.1 ABC transporter substrate-binding protein [Brenneria sp. hezel4-2-4]
MIRFPRRLLLLLCIMTSSLVRAAPVTVQDIAGRHVTVDAPVSRVMLADSRLLLAVNILHPAEPLKNIIAWDDSLRVRAPDMARHYAQRYPQLKQITVFDNPYRSDFSVERALTLRPDLIVFDIGVLPKLQGNGTLAMLEKSGIAVIFIDFRQRPLTHAPDSIRLLGEVFGEQQNAERFIQRWRQLYQRVQDRVLTLPENQRPGVVFENHAGMTGDTCCAVFGRNSYGEFIAAAGGRNLLAEKVPVQGADVSPELLITSNPDYYLLSGADWSQRGKESLAVPLGYEASRETALPRLLHLMARNGVAPIPAVRQKKVMAVYHQFYDSPFNVIALEAIAKFLHPQLFADVDPQADLEALYRDFTGVEYSGLFFLQP